MNKKEKNKSDAYSNSGNGCTIREAKSEDIKQMHVVRMAVNENVLNNPDLVKQSDYLKFISPPNKGWVALVNNKMVGFAIINLEENNVWALFVDPGFEKLGIGRQLHDKMTEWYFNQTKKTLWLSTQPGTRADAFYRKAGWIYSGPFGKEIKFEMHQRL